jgi:hypothetical protein
VEEILRETLTVLVQTLVLQEDSALLGGDNSNTGIDEVVGRKA